MNTEYEDLSHQMFETLGLIRRAGLMKSEGQNGIHHGQGHILDILMHHNNLSQKELADIAHIRAASMTDLLEKLENENLVIRARDEKDRRVTRVSISGKGRELMKDGLKVRKEINEIMYGSLTNSELNQFDTIYKKIISSLREATEKK